MKSKFQATKSLKFEITHQSQVEITHQSQAKMASVIKQNFRKTLADAARFFHAFT